ncbi:unnamed protein product [Calicophoron daubneyi]|uniref:GPI alpha-1,4-mannosyltransferase I, catalytic subunit n=1 Tax=Calicophoron daubneyi TaxID=300641 RepID=A0AAV2TPL9_CALDB
MISVGESTPDLSDEPRSDIDDTVQSLDSNELPSTPVSTETDVSVTSLRSHLVEPSVCVASSGGDVHSQNPKPSESKISSQWAHPHLPSLPYCLCAALAFRLALLIFSVWQDTTRWPDGQLRFTDVDYDVFMDAAEALISRKDIYAARPTYRYSPVIAAIVAPGCLLSKAFAPAVVRTNTTDSVFNLPSDEPLLETVPVESNRPISVRGFAVHDLGRLWGKLVFILADICCAVLQYRIIQVESKVQQKGNERDDSTPLLNHQQLALYLVCLGWLFNPVTAVVSVRGNAEAVLGVCVLSCLLCVIQNRTILAGLLFGLAVHLKLYPIIYAPSVYLWLTRRPKKSPEVGSLRGLCNLLPNLRHVKFGLAALVSLVSLTTWGYVYFGGMRFLNQAYLYHFSRIDIKHNFAPHFYPLYLLSGLSWRASEAEALTGSEAGATMLGKTMDRQFLDRLRSTIGSVFSHFHDDSTLGKSLPRLTSVTQVKVLSQVFGLASLLPALILIPGLSFKLYKIPSLSWFAVTYAFVTFNKVCTSQYFLWSLVLLPAALANLRLPDNVSVSWATFLSTCVWFGGQAVWLASAYVLEMRTIHSTQLARFIWPVVWASSLLFLCSNVWLLRRLISWRWINTESRLTKGHTARQSGSVRGAGEMPDKKNQ